MVLSGRASNAEQEDQLQADLRVYCRRLMCESRAFGEKPGKV